MSVSLKEVIYFFFLFVHLKKISIAEFFVARKNLVRLSVGTEDFEDIIRDLGYALDGILEEILDGTT